MAIVKCTKCSNTTKKGGYPTWVILVAIFLFPIGLLALSAGKEPTVCTNCGHTWQEK
jgi:ribosomal protein L37AE/L43A